MILCFLNCFGMTKLEARGVGERHAVIIVNFLNSLNKGDKQKKMLSGNKTANNLEDIQCLKEMKIHLPACQQSKRKNDEQTDKRWFSHSQGWHNSIHRTCINRSDHHHWNWGKREQIKKRKRKRILNRNSISSEVVCVWVGGCFPAWLKEEEERGEAVIVCSICAPLIKASWMHFEFGNDFTGRQGGRKGTAEKPKEKTMTSISKTRKDTHAPTK